MNNMISVIVPIYAVEKYLEKCIESIRNQTYKNLEIILVDDGSPDGCPSICESYMKIDKRIRVIHKENGGLSSARNSGISIAKGDYISFVDSDDYLYPHMYEKMIDTLKNTCADMCICGIDVIYEGDFRGTLEKIHIEDNVYDKNEFFNLINRWYYVTTVNKLYKKEIFFHLRFPEGKIHEDEFIIHRVVDKCKKIITMSYVGYAYVQRENSIMNSTLSVKHLDLIYALLDRYYFFKGKKMKKLSHMTAIYAYGYLVDYLEKMDFNGNFFLIKPCFIETEKVLIRDRNLRFIKLGYKFSKLLLQKRK